MKKKNIIILCCACIVLAALLFWSWKRWFSPTHVAFVNYQVIALGEISKANDNKFIKIHELSTDAIEKVGQYDMIFINAMGLRITEEQRHSVIQAAERGVPILSTTVTNPANNIISVDTLAEETLRRYINGGGRSNYRNMLNYVRNEIDRKAFFKHEAQAAVDRRFDMIYHADVENRDNENLGFQSVAAYEDFLQKHRLYHAEAPRIIITGPMGEPSALIQRLEENGVMVYPVNDIQQFIRDGHADTVQPSALINMAHGRMGDNMVEYLKQRNIPLFSPLNVNRLVEKWEADKMGMNGGFLSQSVVTPEIDGALRPFALFGHYINDEGLQYVSAIPERLDVFAETLLNYLQLQQKSNADKRVAIFYYKGPGLNSMTAGGMEVGPSLFNLLSRLRQEGYNVQGLPATAAELEDMINRKGKLFNSYAEGAKSDFMRDGNPELVDKETYESWVRKALRPERYAEVVAADGDFPGGYLVSEDGRLGIARVQFGNVVLLPQPAAGKGENSYVIVHGTDAAPPHSYVAPYLWVRYGFKADALFHFGTHGSLEFTPRKQAALCSNDWPDRLVGSMPHFYVYDIADVGEALIAKRRSYGGIQSHLTPPFFESGVRSLYKNVSEAIESFEKALNSGDEQQQLTLALVVKRMTVKEGLHRALELDSILDIPYSEDDIERIEHYVEEMSSEKITGQLYVMGEPYEQERIKSSVFAMATDPIAYSLYALDKLNGKAGAEIEKHRSLFTRRYLNPSKTLVEQIWNNPSIVTDSWICKAAGITPAEMDSAATITKAMQPVDMMAMMMSMGNNNGMVGGNRPMSMERMMPRVNATPASGMMDKMHRKMRNMAKDMDPEQAMKMAEKMGASPEALEKMKASMSGEKGEKGAKGMSGMMSGMMGKKTYSKEQKEWAAAIMEIKRTVQNVNLYKAQMETSPEKELSSIVNALNGGYTRPSSGGDPIVNPNVLPTGANMYGINAEATPSETAWERGKLLANNTIDLYRRRHHDSIPLKVSYTLWSGEFIETQGATIAQILYMLGVEPIRDAFGRVTDLRLIPSEELGRPRIDVVVQTSGQLRDLAASRLFLINRAVEMAAAATDDVFDNRVKEGVIESERTLIEKGVSPKEAREISTYRVFGGVNGNYGTGITGMVQAGDRWEKEEEIAKVYLNNMGAFYGSEKYWETVKQFAFEAALTRTEAVVQPRQSNTWGALSLDHVYEFMGGMNLAVRNVTGKDPDAYLSDYRNRNHVRMQEVKEAIGVESRTTIFNPNYIRERMKGGAGGAGSFAEIAQNTYGWNVMKPRAIDNEIWDEIYEVYVKDKFNLGTQEYFETQNPAALEEITAVMMETARKGMWKATEQQLNDIARLHTELVQKHLPSCSGMVCDNAKLRDFIAARNDEQQAAAYKQQIQKVREQQVSSPSDNQAMVMKKEEMNGHREESVTRINSIVVIVVAVVIVIGLIVFVRRRRKNTES